ncbi:growth hormone-regulated TBC protein 1-A isoform X7 [Magallana gigas]|uniref:growth hormone-regulated TBC protein 1-A isoform X7 n=1 Tax=Magallana gigas TaxID=29159 RepID=UPI003342C8C0
MDEIHNSDNTLRSRVDGYGFDRSDDQHAEAIDKFMASYLSILARRASRWNNLLSSGERISKNRKLKRFCRKGIPNEHRKTMWMLLSGAEEKRKANPRTYRLLLDSQKDERVVETIALDFYSPGMEAVRAEQELLGEIIRSVSSLFKIESTMLLIWKDRELHDHIQEVGVQWCLVGTKWFMCLFADVLPTETVLRIWDCLFFEGNKVLLRVSTLLILQNKERLMACNNFQEMVAEIQEVIKNPKSLNCHKLMKHCFKKLGSFPTTRIEKMRQECLMRVGEQ